MRVDRLYLKNFRNLRDFEVDFHVSSSRQVVVGRNGVGKSNLIEALLWIFRDLDLEQDSKFAYEIEYHCNSEYVKIASIESPRETADEPVRFARTYWIAEGKGQPTETQTGRDYSPLRQAEFYRRNRPRSGQPSPQRLLPQYVFGYYSGVSERFNKIFLTHEENYFREQVSGKEAPLRAVFQARPHHSQFALLSFFAAKDEGAKQFLRSDFHIEGLASVLFILREPYWKRKGVTAGDQRFWGAGGKVSVFLDGLYQQAFAPMIGKAKRRISVGRVKTFDERFCFIPSEERLQQLADHLEPKEFFARLESTIFSDLVDRDGKDVRIRLKLVGQEEPITFDELSEGEQQLLTIIGLMKFTAQNESLFLLDEPDTHLNPAWCLDYLNNLINYGGNPPNSQIIITTHSPLTFAGLDQNEVVVLERGEDGMVTSQHPTSPPKGMGFQAILTSEFFGLRSAIDSETLAKLDRKRELALKEEKTEEELADLTQLDEELGRLDFSKAARDPLYLEFIRAITAAQTANPEIARPAPAAADWHLRQRVASDIAARLLREEADETHETH
jgi:predicted ATPase